MNFKLNSIENYSPDNSLRLAGSAQAHGFGAEINLLVWNVYKARKPNWMSDFSDLMTGQDLVILQEAVLNSHHDHYFENSNRYQWVLARSFRDKRSGIETGVKTGAITPALSPKSIFSPHNEPFSKTPKIVLSTCYQLLDSDLMLKVLNVHAINFVSSRKYTEQLEQLSSEINNHEGPLILAGDFNTWSKKRIKLFCDVTEKSQLQEANMERPDRTRHFSRQLDHVYYRGLSLSHIRSLSGIVSSDHYPISVTFSR